MDIQKRLFRRPVTTALWGLLVTAMALLLCTGAALWYSSENLVTTLDGMYTAAAFRTNKTVTQDGTRFTMGVEHLMQEDVDFLESLDSVEAVHFHTLTGGYSPVFTPLLNHDEEMRLHNYNETYDEVVLIGKLVSSGDFAVSEITYDLTALGLSEQETHSSWVGEIEVEQIVSMHEGYDISVGDKLPLHVSSYGVIPAKFFELNGRYMLSGYLHHYEPQVYIVATNGVTRKEDSLVNNRFVFNWRPDGKADLGGLQTWPFAKKIDGSLEDFLADPANKAWVDYLAAREKANHSVPVMGTDCLESMYSFLNKDVSISEGRSFTQEEYDSGAKVCIISESLALASGLELGDTIPLSQFLVSEVWNNSLEEADYTENKGLENNPTVGEFAPDTEFLTENEEFTIIGIYRKANAWDEGAWEFTVNTVLIPKAAQIPGGYGAVSTVEMIPMEEAYPGCGLSGFLEEYIDRGNYGVYLSVLLKKGHMQDFVTAVAHNTELRGEFFTYDQGYEDMIDSVRAVGESSRKLLYMTAAGWALLLMLYVLLYQGSQRKNLGTMRSLGAKPQEARSYLFGSGMVLAAVSVALGTLVSGLVLNVANDRLLQQMLQITENGQFSGGKGLNAESLADMIGGSQIPGWVMLALVAVQLALFAGVLWAQATNLAKKQPRKLLGV